MRRVLVTGAGGKTGRAVLGALRERGAAARGLVTDPSRLDDVADVETVVGDQRRVEELVAALDGVDAIYAIAPNVSSDEVAMARAAVEACQLAGVDRLVLHSVIHPQLRAMPHHRDKGLAEEVVIESPLAWTIVQPNVYLQNIAGYLDELRAGAYRVPYATSSASAMVDLRDVAEVVAGVLVDDVGVYATFELSGPAPVAPTDVAASAARMLGREVVAERIDPDDWLAANRSLKVAERLHAMFLHYDRHGSAGDATVLRHLLGREPAGLQDYLAELLG